MKMKNKCGDISKTGTSKGILRNVGNKTVNVGTAKIKVNVGLGGLRRGSGRGRCIVHRC